MFVFRPGIGHWHSSGPNIMNTTVWVTLAFTRGIRARSHPVAVLKIRHSAKIRATRCLHRSPKMCRTTSASFALGKSLNIFFCSHFQIALHCKQHITLSYTKHNSSPFHSHEYNSHISRYANKCCEYQVVEQV